MFRRRSCAARANFAVSGIGMFLFDVSSKGTWLVTRNDDVRSARVLVPGETSDRELSWLGSVSGASGGLSADGRMLLFTYESESAGPTYAVSVRNTDGTPPVRLGPGAAVAFSPDGRYLYFSKDVTPGQNFEYDKNPYQTIYAIIERDLRTGKERRLVGRPGGSIAPRPSPRRFPCSTASC